MNPSQVNIRRIIPHDVPAVLQVDYDNFAFPEEELLLCLRQRSVFGIVAEVDDQIVGFIIYELHPSRLYLLNLAVAVQWRRRGIGRQMIRKLVSKLSQRDRRCIELDVRETNLPAQLFMRNIGFRAVSVLRDYYDDAPEDAYVMQYCLARPEDKWRPENRILRYWTCESR